MQAIKNSVLLLCCAMYSNKFVVCIIVCVYVCVCYALIVMHRCGVGLFIVLLSRRDAATQEIDRKTILGGRKAGAAPLGGPRVLGAPDRYSRRRCRRSNGCGVGAKGRRGAGAGGAPRLVRSFGRLWGRRPVVPA